jgi:hypothetical protein
LGFDGLLFFLLVFFAGFFHFGPFFLFSGVGIDDSQTKPPHIETTVDVIKIALLDEFGKFCEIVLGIEEVHLECFEGEGPFEMSIGRVVGGSVHELGKF